MNEEKKGMPLLLRQAVRFVGLSGVGWLLDMCVYTVLSLMMKDLVTVNIISSLVGASFVFAFSTRFVFRDSHRIPLGWKYAIYIVYQLLLIWLISHLLARVNEGILLLFESGWIRRSAALLSKIIVTPVTMTVNFFAMKGVIEKL